MESFEYLKHSSALITVQNKSTAMEKYPQPKHYCKVPRHSLLSFKNNFQTYILIIENQNQAALKTLSS